MNTELTEKQAEAYKLHNKILVSGQMAAEYLVDLAKNLRQMRDTKLYTELGFETFEAYCEDAAHIKQRQAYNFIKALDEFGESGLQSNASLGITKLTALATLCADDREQLMQSVDVASISTRELEEKIAELKKKCEQLELELDTTKTEKEAEMQVVVEAASKADEKMNQAKEEKRRLEDKLTELQARYDELKNRPVEVAVAEPDEKTIAKIRSEAEEKAKEKAAKEVNAALQKQQEAEKKTRELENQLNELQAIAKNSAPSGGTKELLKFHFSNIKTAFNSAAAIISAMEDGEEKEKFKAALKKLVEECGKAAEV